MTDPWAATQQNSSEMASNLAGEPEDSGEGSSLFGGAKVRSLFNSHVKAGEKRVGIIALPPVDRQSYNIEGKPKYWDNVAKAVVTTNANGERPLKDTVITLDTAYRFTPDELADDVLKIDAAEAAEDEGRRSLRLNGALKKELIKAIRAAGIRSDKELVGWELTVDRGRKASIGGGKTQWQGGTVSLRKP